MARPRSLASEIALPTAHSPHIKGGREWRSPTTGPLRAYQQTRRNEYVPLREKYPRVLPLAPLPQVFRQGILLAPASSSSACLFPGDPVPRLSCAERRRTLARPFGDSRPATNDER